MAEVPGTIEVTTPTDNFVLKGRPCELSAHSFIPTDRKLPRERTYFNVEKQERYSSSTFDRLFHHDYGYEEMLHRCDREHAKSRGLEVNKEEFSKAVPSLSSSIYGHRLDPPEIDPPNRKHVRIGHVQSQFYRRRNFNLNPVDPDEEKQ